MIKRIAILTALIHLPLLSAEALQLEKTITTGPRITIVSRTSLLYLQKRERRLIEAIHRDTTFIESPGGSLAEFIARSQAQEDASRILQLLTKSLDAAYGGSTDYPEIPEAILSLLIGPSDIRALKQKQQEYEGETTTDDETTTDEEEPATTHQTITNEIADLKLTSS